MFFRRLPSFRVRHARRYVARGILVLTVAMLLSSIGLATPSALKLGSESTAEETERGTKVLSSLQHPARRVWRTLDSDATLLCPLVATSGHGHGFRASSPVLNPLPALHLIGSGIRILR
ncbi:MAG: hypothetical protein J5I93_22290 [Pirellulaceae bacterium]|nr:hypothetical protein [Pirellulaceae bacterium]